MTRRLVRVLTWALGCAAAGGTVGAGEANTWRRLEAASPADGAGAVLLFARDANRFLLFGGEGKSAGKVQAFDPAAASWSEISTNALKDRIHPYYQAAYDPKTKTVYGLSNGSVLYTFGLEEKVWKARPPEPLLDKLSWHMLAGDPEGGRLVVVGSDKRIENVGWTRTVVYDIAAAKWETLPLPEEKIVQEHRDLVAATEAMIDLVGRIRLAWYRDPKGVGTETELKALVERADGLAKLAGMEAFKGDLAPVAELLKGQKTLDALKAARALQRKIEDRAFEQYPVPCSRRNAPLVFDEKNKVFVLFGGDHEDYQMNDTWILDLAKKAWRRAKPEGAPSPRAGHAMVYLPKSGRVAVYEGYVPSSSPDYGAGPAWVLDPRELWAYDVKADRWDLLGSWAAKGQSAAPPAVGGFYGYSASWYGVPPLAADADDRLLLATPARKQEKGELWSLRADPAAADAAGREKLVRPANERRLRAEYFRADFCEVPNEPKLLDVAALPANAWTAFPRPPRVPAAGCRQRDWSTTTWDSDRGQVLMWGGGHCVRSSSAVLHFSPISNRIVEGYDADEPYCYNGWCGPASSLLNKQWIDTHAYHLYAYDPKCKLMVTARSFLYDPERMDWVRAEPHSLPFRYSWGHVVIASSPHGAVAWANAVSNDTPSLWLFDREKGWQPLEPKGKLFTPYCDSHGMVYDSKRDRMLLSSVGGGYAKKSNGTFLSFDFKTKAIETVTPENAELNQTGCARELVYVEHADWVLIGDLMKLGDGKDPKTRWFTRVYDAGKNKMFLLEAGSVAAGFSAGWMYDAAQKAVYSFSYRGQAWALRIDPASAKLLEKLPDESASPAAAPAP